MDKQILNIYLGELESQSQMAMNAVNALDELGAIRLKNLAMSPECSRQLTKEYFRTIHSLLTHLSNISKLIWPPALSKDCFCHKPRANGLKCTGCIARSRSKEILLALEINSADHTLRSRTLRDHLEHFDERLDDWAQTSDRKNYVQDWLGPKGGIVGMEESDMMRQYDPASANFSFRGETYSLVDLVAGLNDILSRSKRALLFNRGF